MEPIDYRHNYREYYAPADPAPHWVELPRMNVLAIDGTGPMAEAEERLARLAAVLRRTVRRQMHVDFAPMPVETLWHGEGRWTLLVMQPPFVYRDAVAAAGDTGARFASFGEGRALQCVQPLPLDAVAVGTALRARARADGHTADGPLHAIPLDASHAVVRLALSAPVWSDPRPGYL